MFVGLSILWSELQQYVQTVLVRVSVTSIIIAHTWSYVEFRYRLESTAINSSINRLTSNTAEGMPTPMRTAEKQKPGQVWGMGRFTLSSGIRAHDTSTEKL